MIFKISLIAFVLSIALVVYMASLGTDSVVFDRAMSLVSFSLTGLALGRLIEARDLKKIYEREMDSVPISVKILPLFWGVVTFSTLTVSTSLLFGLGLIHF